MVGAVPSSPRDPVDVDVLGAAPLVVGVLAGDEGAQALADLAHRGAREHEQAVEPDEHEHDAGDPGGDAAGQRVGDDGTDHAPGGTPAAEVAGCAGDQVPDREHGDTQQERAHHTARAGLGRRVGAQEDDRDAQQDDGQDEGGRADDRAQADVQARADRAAGPPPHAGGGEDGEHHEPEGHTVAAMGGVDVPGATQGADEGAEAPRGEHPAAAQRAHDRPGSAAACGRTTLGRPTLRAAGGAAPALRGRALLGRPGRGLRAGATAARRPAAGQRAATGRALVWCLGPPGHAVTVSRAHHEPR